MSYFNPLAVGSASRTSSSTAAQTLTVTVAPTGQLTNGSYILFGVYANRTITVNSCYLNLSTGQGLTMIEQNGNTMALFCRPWLSTDSTGSSVTFNYTPSTSTGMTVYGIAMVVLGPRNDNSLTGAFQSKQNSSYPNGAFDGNSNGNTFGSSYQTASAANTINLGSIITEYTNVTQPFVTLAWSSNTATPASAVLNVFGASADASGNFTGGFQSTGVVACNTTLTNFASSGSFIVGGQFGNFTVNYTSKSGSNFLGCTVANFNSAYQAVNAYVANQYAGVTQNILTPVNDTTATYPYGFSSSTSSNSSVVSSFGVATAAGASAAGVFSMSTGFTAGNQYNYLATRMPGYLTFGSGSYTMRQMTYTFVPYPSTLQLMYKLGVSDSASSAIALRRTTHSRLANAVLVSTSSLRRAITRVRSLLAVQVSSAIAKKSVTHLRNVKAYLVSTPTVARFTSHYRNVTALVVDSAVVTRVRNRIRAITVTSIGVAKVLRSTIRSRTARAIQVSLATAARFTTRVRYAKAVNVSVATAKRSAQYLRYATSIAINSSVAKKSVQYLRKVVAIATNDSFVSHFILHLRIAKAIAVSRASINATLTRIRLVRAVAISTSTARKSVTRAIFSVFSVLFKQSSNVRASAKANGALKVNYTLISRAQAKAQLSAALHESISLSSKMRVLPTPGCAHGSVVTATLCTTEVNVATDTSTTIGVATSAIPQISAVTLASTSVNLSTVASNKIEKC